MLDVIMGVGGRSLDLKTLGESAAVCVKDADYGRITMARTSGAWTDAVWTVYGTVDGTDWHETGETLTASDRKTGAIDCIGWAKLKVVLTTADTGPAGGAAKPAWIFKAPK